MLPVMTHRFRNAHIIVLVGGIVSLTVLFGAVATALGALLTLVGMSFGMYTQATLGG